MEGAKKIVVLVVLLAIIVAAVIYGVRKLGAGAARPEFVGQMQIMKMDRDTLETTSLPLGEWEKLGYTGTIVKSYKNPNTGKYTMADTMECSTCKERIPWPEVPADKGSSFGALEGYLTSYKCPKCGKQAYYGIRGRPLEPGEEAAPAPGVAGPPAPGAPVPPGGEK